MRKIIAVIVALACCVNADKVFLLSGQSNMGGEGYAPDVLANFKDIDNVKIYSANSGGAGSWYSPLTLGCCGNIAGKQFGPEIGMAKHFKKKFPGEQIYFIKVAYSATCLSCPKSAQYLQGPWLDVSSFTWTWFVQQYTNAIKTSPIKISKIDGIFWMQGEGDGGSYQTAISYASNLSLFAQRMRQLVGDQNTPFIFGQIQNWTKQWPYGEIVQAQQLLASNQIPNSKLVMRSSDLPTWDIDPTSGGQDPFHYNTVGQLELGRVFGIAASSALPAEIVASVVSFPR